MFTFKKYVITFSLIFILTELLIAQHIPSDERGDVRYRRKAQMEGNQVRTTVFNYGMAGREGGEFPIFEQTPFEWPKNTGKVYLAVAGIMVGAEVVDDRGDVQRIISRPHYLSSPEGRPWTFEPIPGYYNESNPEGFATSNDPATWPSSWPDKIGDESDPGWTGKWNGYFGKDVFNADQELFFRASDNLYDRYAYYFPDTTDLTRKGLGLILDTRVMAWSQILVQDAVYFLFKIKNDGTKPLEKVGVSILWADFVGAEGNDNLSEYDILNKIAWSRNSDNRSPDPAFGSDPVGIIAGVFLETPGNSIDRIDNDGDSPELGPKISEEMLAGEGDPSIPLNDPRRSDGLDNNGNGLIDENLTHVPFGDQVGVTYADRIGQPIDPSWLNQHPRFHLEENSPLVSQEMVNQSAGDKWKRWPSFPEDDPIQLGQVHLIMVEADDIGLPFKDYIDNDGNGEEGSPVITQEMIDAAANDVPYFRYAVNNNIILYNVSQVSLGMKYADGIDNNNDGAIDENIDEGIDVMIDESRSNGIDDDYDWNPITDDVGLDGVAFSSDPGEDDGWPTSGARFGLPGEPNIDVTDVGETDQIGLTGSFYRPSSEWIDIYTDNFIWNNFMVPGNFFDPANVVRADYNLFINSGLFPLQPGQEEPVSFAVILANGPAQDPNGQSRKQEILRKKVRAQETYDNDYQFANAPITPQLTAVPGNNRVTLYWDAEAEKTFDRYIANIGGNGFDFEGYRIYRSSDPAFEDAKVITNANGTPSFLLPVAQFDIENGIAGYDSVGFEGVHFYLGDDTGLQHSWTDSTVQNGFTYYYAMTSYDFGFPIGNIGPSESNISISLNPDGSVKTLGRNVVQVTPEAATSGYIPPTLGEIELIKGTTAGQVFYDIVDPDFIKEGHVYHITFEDTILPATITRSALLTTKNYTVYDSTANSIRVDRNYSIGDNVEYPLTDGFRLNFQNSSVEFLAEQSKWNNSDEIPQFTFETVATGSVRGTQVPYDYTVVFGETGIDTSKTGRIGTTVFPSMPVNFKVFNNSKNEFIDFIFVEADTSGGAGKLTTRAAFRDRIVFVEELQGDSLLTWWFYLNVAPNETQGLRNPQAGDTASVRLKKPFLSEDQFRFVAKRAFTDIVQAKIDLNDIKVVPNPYLANAQWETKNPYSSGRGPRSIHFTHLPSKCTIRIFNVNGELVKEILHESTLQDGTAEWDLLSKDNLSVSYGVYIYHVEAQGIGSKAGKFAIIK